MTDLDPLELVEMLRNAPPDRRARLLQTLSRRERLWLEARLEEAAELRRRAAAISTSSPRREELELHPWQIPPEGDWGYWLAAGGRGAGKSQSCAAYVYDHILSDPPCIDGVPGGHVVNLVGPTQGDSAATVRKDYLPLDQRLKLTTRHGGTFVDFPNGAGVRLLGAYTQEDVTRLRAAGDVCVTHAEELAWWRQVGYGSDDQPSDKDAWDQVRISTRAGVHKIVVSSTPRPAKFFRRIWDRCQDPDDPRWVMTRGTTYEATHLPADYRAELIELYEGTRLEAQELLGLLMDDVAGALWTSQLLDDTRVASDAVPALTRVAIGVDPNFSEEDKADEAGIIVGGIGRPPGAKRDHAYILDDLSCRGAFVWPKVAVVAYRDRQARAIVAEANLGGKDFLRKMIAGVELDGQPVGGSVKVEPVHARQGKRTRAEPYAAAYERQRVHHVGTLALLEGEMTTWVPGDDSPNRLDALVWLLAYLLPDLHRSRARVSGPV